MKREFGAPLVRFLSSKDVEALIDTSGAYIPGHGTPTVIVLARSRPAIGSTLRVVDCVSGEPRQPADPAAGLVWSAIVQLVDRPGEQNAYVRAADIERHELFEHPMTMGVGRTLRRRLEAGQSTLWAIAEAVGVVANTGDDAAYPLPDVATAARLGVQTHDLVEGSAVRDWSFDSAPAIYPHEASGRPVLDEPTHRRLWPLRRVLEDRKLFGTPIVDRGGTWFQWGELHLDKLRAGILIAWGEVATHNHFVLERTGRLFKQTAPVIKLSDGASEEKYLSVLGLLNSSTACFWLKQVAMNKGGGGINEGHRGDAWEFFFQFASTKVKEAPLPGSLQPGLPAAIDALATERAALLRDLNQQKLEGSLASRLAELRERDTALIRQMVSLQEELDWQVLSAYGLVPHEIAIAGEAAPPIAFGERAFEIVLARRLVADETDTTWFERHRSTPITEIPDAWPAEYRAVVQQRVALIEADSDIALIESPEHKRRWSVQSWEDRQEAALTSMILDALEDREFWADLRLRSASELTDHLRRLPVMIEAIELLSDKDADLGATVSRLLVEAAVPSLVALRLTEKGMRKRRIWEGVWDQQRAKDHGQAQAGGVIPLPPRYVQADFRSSIYWKHRGKLDVATERFVSVPNAHRGADRSPVVGWAGWDERDLARALAGRIMELREQEAADAERLAPLLANVLELLPWVHQWHPESDMLYGGPPGQYFESWLDGQLAELGITRDNLRAWRPPATTRGRKAKAGAA